MIYCSIKDDDVVYISSNDDCSNNSEYIALIFSKDTNEFGHKFYSELFDNDLDVLKLPPIFGSVPVVVYEQNLVFGSQNHLLDA